MPPGPAYNWLCVVHSVAEILAHAARYRAAQLSPSSLSTAHASLTRKKRPVDELKASERERFEQIKRVDTFLGEAPGSTTSRELQGNVVPDASLPASPKTQSFDTPAIPMKAPDVFPPAPQPEVSTITQSSPPLADFPPQKFAVRPGIALPKPLSSDVLPSTAKNIDAVLPDNLTVQKSTVQPGIPVLKPPSSPELSFPLPTRNLQSSKVPSSRIGRLFHYGGLAASLSYGAASELIRRTSVSGSGVSTQKDAAPVIMTEANIKRLVGKLSQMRGAALKLGQFLSIQDTRVLPPEVDKIFRRVQDSAHYMPDWQMEQVLLNAIPTYSTHFTSFSRLPFAAASIGQVHTATLSASSSPTGNAEEVAVKIQFPGVVKSIESDLGYMNWLLSVGGVLPRGLFLDRTVQVMKDELADECDYTREASFLRLFGSPSHLGKDPRYKVPWVWSGSTDTVLVMERVGGVSVGEADVRGWERGDRDEIAARVIELCLKELFEFRAMQTDPNWTNFLWNSQTRQIELVDFGATRTYSNEFMDNWLRLLQAAAAEDREACIEWSLELGYLTGEESQTMLNAHISSLTLLATPFNPSTPQPFSFGPGSKWSEITAEIRAQIPVMLRERLTPPPRETYSLNRKLSGAFLLASRLGAKVDTKEIWDRVVGGYEFGL